MLPPPGMLVRTLILNPAALRMLVACDKLLLTMFGTVTSGGPLETTSVIVLSRAAVPAEGLWLMTTPLATDSEYCRLTAGLAEIDLATGAVRRVIPVVRRPGDQQSHVLGDLALGPDGSVYLPDSGGPTVWRLAPGANALEAWVESAEFLSLQGVVVAAEAVRSCSCAAAAAFAAAFPHIAVTASVDVLPETGEYERTSTAAVNAYVLPAIRGYLQRLEQKLRLCGVTAPLLIGNSNGGLSAAQVAQDRDG